MFSNASYLEIPDGDDAAYERYLATFATDAWRAKLVALVASTDFGIYLPSPGRTTWAVDVLQRWTRALGDVVETEDDDVLIDLLVMNGLIPRYEDWDACGPAEKADRDEHADDH